MDRYKNRKCFCGRAIISPYPTHPALNFTHATFNVWNNRTLTFYYQVWGGENVVNAFYSIISPATPSSPPFCPPVCC